MGCVAPWKHFGGNQRIRPEIKRPWRKALSVVGDVLCFSGVFNFHISEFLRVENLATLHALDIFRVFLPGDDSYFGMSADGCHHCSLGTRSDATFARL